METFDGWTIAHLVTGAVLAAAGVSRRTAYGIIIGTEIAEKIARGRGVTFFDETPANVLVDLAASAAGFEIVLSFNK